MNYETTLARAASRAAGTAWKRHLGICSLCRQRPVMPRCDEGRGLFLARQEASRALAENRRLDAGPAPAQESLF